MKTNQWPWAMKDLPPEDTINNIENILRSNHINIETIEERGHNNYWDSTRVEIKGIKNIGTNGKGTTLEYSMASALGEFMERLQAQQLIHG